MSHQIDSVVPDSRGHSAYASDPDFARLFRLYADDALVRHTEPRLKALGALVGDELEQLALTADKNPPTLQLRARNGAESQRIEKHPAYQRLEEYALAEFGLAAMSHRAGVFGWPERLPPIVKYSLTYLFVQAEFGLMCPVSMTDSLTRTLRKFGDPALVERFIGPLTSQDFGELYQGAMFMTEQEAGSDVGATVTEARLEDGVWRLYGDKWFCSNPDADLAMVLARPAGAEPGTRGLTLFLLPRKLADGSLNRYRIIRLKDKMGTRSMASGEIVLEGAEAYIVGEQGKGFKHMTDMINMSRLSNGVRAAGLMRRSLNEALFVARNRSAFGKRLIELPLMGRQLIKIMVSTEQGRSMVFHTADCLRRADAGDDDAAKLLRILTPLIKFRTTRDARKAAGDGMEVRGGCGYIEEFSDARVLRDSHLGSIWEGTSNIVALDVFRAIRREGTLPVLQRYLHSLLGDVGLPDASMTLLANLVDEVADRALMQVDADAEEADVRQIASALYNITSAVFLAWEAAKMGDNWRRLALAHLVIVHKLLPRDPLGTSHPDQAQLNRALLEERELTLDEAIRLVPACKRRVEEVV
ncbi:acyl-CoA dehydrogenase family protein [Marinobacter sp.]|uniref:acyl-CoA dehydrogenase family protein n=1 Tax=Marinobacter sp. TaxID=50741 RepID=UPI0019890A2E|nr:acyl-CoA dehydrogenase family protein [Marinobacter sp.]MBD3656985.1 acyl-CoA dehydrogenase family protein [Marinobacter sp.]